ncbi:MAG TPA: Sec-independent protein translocase protein TatB [Gammaproteobacteria bacterium]|nr:Sec-independent protein translocase protein TatB [Gammaproteobacteria bacterium]
MFEIGPGELVLVAIIGLLVLGPQRLPKVAAEVGKWVSRARRTATQLRRQLEREIELSEIEKPSSPPAPPSPSPPPSAAQPTGEVPPGPGTHVDQQEPPGSTPPEAPDAPASPEKSAETPSS